jgi:hypothetical protein
MGGDSRLRAGHPERMSVKFTFPYMNIVGCIEWSLISYCFSMTCQCRRRIGALRAPNVAPSLRRSLNSFSEKRT